MKLMTTVPCTYNKNIYADKMESDAKTYLNQIQVRYTVIREIILFLH